MVQSACPLLLEPMLAILVVHSPRGKPRSPTLSPCLSRHAQFNGLMTILYLGSLQRLPSLQATVVSLSANILLSVRTWGMPRV